MSAPVVDTVLDLVGRTPLVRLRRLGKKGGAAVWGKCEHLNPGGSVKDRICLSMIEAAERGGRLKPGDTVVEPTSGNTGIGLALVCATKGYKLVLTMPASMSLERRALLEAYGAEVIFTEPDRSMEGALEAARRVVKERDAFMPHQFENPANPRIHEETTAREILEAFGSDSVDALIAAVGTGGTVSGVGKVLKETRPATQIIAVEPESSPVLEGGPPGPSKIQGLNAGFVPANYHAEVVDEIRHVSDQDAWDMKVALAKQEGLLVGISAGANVRVAIDIASQLPPSANVVTILCDTGERYFSLQEYFK